MDLSDFCAGVAIGLVDGLFEPLVFLTFPFASAGGDGSAFRLMSAEGQTAATLRPAQLVEDQFKLAAALSFTYMCFLKLNHWLSDIGTIQHRKIMTMIDRHFSDSSPARIAPR